MLKKRERLTKREFDHYFKNGRRYHAPFFTLIYTKDATFHGAVVVGKKVSKKAVERNKIRRRTYSALYALKKTMGLTGIYIVLTKPPIKSVSYAAVTESLIELVGKCRNSG